ncbi:hypothetical protein BCR43DRAFT_484436 [Syncephalastrum racemosum]|uniref:PHD-type domain-containing protein n=1 Tax=Syncephalastrum racemosum TaxID=13706 RepID=A0A1X2HKS5_SYNRA|nr:hypothetical protein BCR43DRAFT_484436 [Syncephalastrum racemosum]
MNFAPVPHPYRQVFGPAIPAAAGAVDYPHHHLQHQPQVVVPSMSPYYYYYQQYHHHHSPPHPYHPSSISAAAVPSAPAPAPTATAAPAAAVPPSAPAPQPAPPVMMRYSPPPIHHTLENATISYDNTMTIQPNQLVKDVFFSSQALVDPGFCSSLSESDASDITPSDLLHDQDDPLFFIGLDFEDPDETAGKKRKLQDDPVDQQQQQQEKLVPSIKKAKQDVPDMLDCHAEDDISAFTDSSCSSTSGSDNEDDEDEDDDDTDADPSCVDGPLVEARPTARPTLYEKLTETNVDWCRYCGTTEGVNWRPGPWGKRTLCNKHGCDYKGYGFACKLPRLDLTGFLHESLNDRERPVLQLFCHVCHRSESYEGNVLVRCEGCPKAVHEQCHSDTLPSSGAWYCNDTCRDNVRRQRVVVELPRKRLPLMRQPSPASSPAVSAASSPSIPRTRSTRASSSV